MKPKVRFFNWGSKTLARLINFCFFKGEKIAQTTQGRKPKKRFAALS